MSKAKGALVIAGVAAALALASGLVAAGIKNVRQQRAGREENEQWKLKATDALRAVIDRVEEIQREFGALLSAHPDMAALFKARQDSIQSVRASIEAAPGLSTDALRLCCEFLRQQYEALQSLQEKCRTLAAASNPKAKAGKKKTRTKK